jgi:hypothetical protein
MYSTVVTLLALVALVTPSPTSYHNITKVPKQTNKDIFIHWMPWFENKQTNTNGQWGIHWTMANKNPDNIIGPDDKREIAAHYYPDIHPYGSADPATIDYQIQMMQMAGADGVLIDWPGTIGVNDLGKNHENCMAFINRLESSGLRFAIVYEDRNLEHTGDKIGQARRDMEFARDNFFNRANYIKYNLNAPLLLTFGPIQLQTPSEWEQVFSVLPQKPTFLTLWYESQDAGSNAQGEYAWVYSDFMDGLDNFYNNRPLGVKMGVAYPGFHDYYSEGGWGPSYFFIDHDGTNTFSRTLNRALQSDVPMIQICTWNDYGEGTIIEPTREYGNQFLNILAGALGVNAGDNEFNMVKQLYVLRKEAEKNKDFAKLQKLQEVHEALNSVEYERAAELLSGI